MGKVTTKVKKTELVKMGRPTKFDISLFKEVCTKIAEGNPLKTILRSDEKYPHWTTFYEWIRADDKLPEEDRLGLSILIAHAREDGHDAIAEETLEIADDASNDWMEKFDKDGKNIGWELNGEHIQRSKLRIETRLKLLAKWNPKKYGDKVDVNHGGQDTNPIQMLIQQVGNTSIKPVEDADDE